MEYVLANPNLPWNWHGLSGNPNVGLEHVLANRDLPWDWIGLSCNPSTTKKHILANKHLPWDRRSVLSREFDYEPDIDPNHDIEYILSCDHWNWIPIARQINFTKINKKPIIKDYFAKTNILNRWNDSFLNPNYQMCVDRLMGEFLALF